MTTVFSRLLLVALASASILLARKALEYHERALPTRGRPVDLASAPRRWVQTTQLVSPRGLARRPCPRPRFYQVRWLGRPGAPAGSSEW